MEYGVHSEILIAKEETKHLPSYQIESKLRRRSKLINHTWQVISCLESFVVVLSRHVNMNDTRIKMLCEN
jgi:hypothetical protein